ncbi:lipopolysaccharide biosynthesis protein [Pyrococcus kukulkanii]|uniref:Polysaccharide biosynthesis C-terminal domain-containing protein n=1 Tax=Pyrococcus kukulkanii TaxID=1609559 RepID=A0ABV4T5F5_9EURY
MDKRRVIIRHSLASIIALAVFGGSRFLYNIVVARRYGVEVLGEVNSLISQAFLLAGFLAFFSVGLGKFTAEFLGRGEEEKIKSITGVSYAFPLLGLLLVPLNFQLAVLSVLRALQLTFRSFIYGLHRGEIYAYAVLLGFLGFLVGFLDGVLMPYYLLLGVISGFGLAYSMKFLGKPGVEEVKGLVKYSSWAFLGGIAGIFLIQAPYFLTEKLAGSRVAGAVSAMLSTSFMLSYMPQVLQSAIVPLYAFDHGRGRREEVRALAEEATTLLSLLTALAVFLMLLLSNLLGNIFRIEFEWPFLLSLLAVEVYVVFNPLINVLSATEYIKRSAIYSLIGALVSLLLWLPLIPRIHETGTFLGLLAGYSIIFLLVLAETRRRFGVKIASIRPFVLAVPLQAISIKLPVLGLIAYLLIEYKDLRRAVRLFLRGIRS